ncbi:conserved hypothetical protein [Histoplasma capsulatum G186AR]|uniref:STEEP1 domain-containing protein n=2 Tax=Ajellomyces capsulatus TaxID=5037 RepID=C0NLE2_AJECG|nr:uncharacterized protein HCBG_04322 [Histoplasma capsulatum G186AR]EEH07443.1 conserved hypothetical protein [Histoplasma capsulatum G186AR]KAG5304417.1 hypothetical protein I7I52_02745 [Histoplasma capsulatum]QSS70015.1 hypothetical protein I7I50_11508 [Histoplasma capsulatum G186AR]
MGDNKLSVAAKSPSPSSKMSDVHLSQPRSQSPMPAIAGTGADANVKVPKTLQTRLPIKTYHCTFCNHLLLTSTRDLSVLPRRREPARDRALILPLPKTGVGEEEDADEDEESEDENGCAATEEAVGNDSSNTQQGTGDPTAESKVKKRTKPGSTQKQPEQQQQHYTILLSTTIPDRKSIIIRREDGFEKRLMLRCGRCRVVMGYALDEVHFPDHNVGAGAGARAAGKGGGDGKTGDGENDGDDKEEKAREIRRKKAEEVVYILPGALVETGEMGKGAIKVETEEWANWEKGAK